MDSNPTAGGTAVGGGNGLMAGNEGNGVVQKIARVRKQGFAFTLVLLGEAIIREDEADAYQQAYLKLIAGLSEAVNGWPENVILDRDQDGPLPRVNVSIKLSALYSQFGPVDPVGAAAAVKLRLRPLLRTARERGPYRHSD